MLVATLLAPFPIITAAILRQAAMQFNGSGAVILDGGYAAEFLFEGPAQAARAKLLRMFARYPFDVIVQPVQGREKKLLVADMDSTMITIECIDELADFIGRKPEVAEVTEAAMRGELDFVQALDARVALLKGLPASALQRCYDERVKFSPGAETLIRTLDARGCHTVLVSGGFTFFTSRVRAALGFALDRANTLDMSGDTLAGTVARPVVTAEVKKATLLEQAAAFNLPLEVCLAIGDGANDIPMIETAGLGIAYRAKAKTEAAAAASLRHADLSSLLTAMGIPRKDWIQAA